MIPSLSELGSVKLRKGYIKYDGIVKSEGDGNGDVEERYEVKKKVNTPIHTWGWKRDCLSFLHLANTKFLKET